MTAKRAGRGQGPDNAGRARGAMRRMGVALGAALGIALGLGSPQISGGGGAAAEARGSAKAPRSAPIPQLSPRREAMAKAAASAAERALARARPQPVESAAPPTAAPQAEEPDAAQRLADQMTIARFAVAAQDAAAQEDSAQKNSARETATLAKSGDPSIRPAFPDARLGDKARGEASLPLKPRSGPVGFVLADPKKGVILERRNADLRLIPASVAKAPTALYALDALGPDFRFRTRLMADGPVRNGVLRGDLYLVGGGDPALDVNDLAQLAEDLKAAGVDRVAGRFYFDESAIPPVSSILASQPPQAGYNPAVNGLILNFNRVFLEWRRKGKGKNKRYEFTAKASARGRSVVTDRVIGVAVPKKQARAGFAWSERPRVVGPGVRDGVAEVWEISTRHLNRKGGRFLPLRRPGPFAAGVFQDLAFEAGVRLPAPRAGAAPGGAVEIAAHESGRLEVILRGMLRFSTNVTAEAVGLAASRARGLRQMEIERSSALMSSWADTRFGLLRAAPDVDAAPTQFRNHSGLSMESRLTARSMVSILVEAARSPASYDKFFELLPRYRMRGLPRRAQVRAKTGTVYYGRGLAGYLQCPKGRRLAFAYLHSDIEGRKRFDRLYDPASGRQPGGASAWLGRARAIEKKLLARWAKKYC